jgi:protein ImuA
MRISASRSELVQTLAGRIQEIEASGFVPKRSLTHSLGIPRLDAILPGRRLAAGSLVELLAATEGAGVWSLALFLAKQVATKSNALVVVDSQRCFYPPAAAKLGLELARTIVVRPHLPSEAHAAVQEALRCSAVGAVIGWHQQLRGREYRQLQLAAEAGGSIGFILRPPGAVRAPSFAVLRLLVSPVVSTGSTRRLQVQVVRCRSGKEGQSLLLEMDDETGHVHSPGELAASTFGSRTARVAT